MAEQKNEFFGDRFFSLVANTQHSPIQASPVSPHLHQNGFQTGNLPGTSPNAQNFASTQAQGQGTWTGNNTLTYTQSMQPPDPRNHHPGYCEW